MTDELQEEPEPIRAVPRCETDAFVIRAARIAAPVFRKQQWKWGGGRDSPSHVPDEPELALALCRDVAHVLREAREGRQINLGTGRLVVRHGDGEIEILLQLSTLNITDYDELERREVAEKGMTPSEHIAELRATLNGRRL